MPKNDEVAAVARYICRNFICSTSCKECGYGSTAREHAEAIVALPEVRAAKQEAVMEYRGDQRA